jgi:hypothetical protein
VIGVGREFFVGVVDIVEEDSRSHGSCLSVIRLLRLVSVDGRLQRLRGSFAVPHVDRKRVTMSCTDGNESFVKTFGVGRFGDDVVLFNQALLQLPWRLSAAASIG